MADTSALDSDDVSLSSQHTPSVPSRPSPAPRLQFLFGDQSPSADEQQASTSRSISPGRASRTLQNSCNQIENLQRALGTTNTGTLTPRTPPLPTLKALYPPDVLLANRAIKTDEDGECTSNDTRKKWFHILEPFKNKKKKEAKDFASVVNPTAPRIAAPQPAAAKSLPPPTVRGPKGVSHPNLNEQLRSVERLRVQKNQISSSSDLPPTPGTSKTESFAGTVRKTSETASEQSCVIPERAPVNEYIESNINQNTSSRQDAYADLVQNLARDEEKAQPQFSSMPVHETAFLPQRGAQLPWQPAVAGGRSAIGARDSEGYTTTDDEFDNVPLRRTASSRHYDSDRVKYVDRTRSLSPPPVLVTHITNRGSLPIMGQVDPRQLLMYQNNVLPNQWSPYGYIMQTSPRNNYPPQQPCTSQVTYAPHVTCSSPLPQQVLPQRPRSASPLVRGSPARMSIGPSSRGRTPYQHDIIHEEQCSEPPVMKRSFSLNSENLQHARQAANQINLRTSMSGCLESPTKRVSFSSLPNKQKDINGNGSQSAPNTPSRTPRPSSSDSVFLYSPGDAPDKPLPPVPEHQVCDHSHGVYSAPPTKPSGGFQVMLGSPTRWHNQDNNRAMQQHQRQHASPGSESGSEAGEVQRILFKQPQATYVSFKEDEWTSDGKTRGPSGSEQSAAPAGRDEDVRRGGGGSRNRRDEPRRHTLSGDQQAGGASAAANLSRSMDLERSYYHQPAPISSTMFDDDPGIMSEVETASTGFRRGGKQRSSLPVVRTPSKTLERPLGLVFLQYRNETKRALLPNEITSIDTVKALFVRSFPKQLTMEYLDAPMVKIYIHDSSKDMFYELEDLRSHLRDIRDRSVLRLFETPDINGGAGGGVPVGGTPMPGALPPHPTPAAWDQDQSYFSEPEFDSEYQHQHIHKTKGSSKGGSSPYYMAHSYPPGQPGQTVTLPRGAPPIIRAYSPATKPVSQAGVSSPPMKPQRTYQDVGRDAHTPLSSPSSPPSNHQRPQSTPPRPPERWAYLARSRQPNSDRLHSESGYMSSPERGRPPYSAYPAQNTYEDPYYAQYGPRSGSITPVIDEEASDSDELMMDSYSIYGSKVVGGSAAAARIQQPSPRPPSFPATGNIASQSAGALVPYDATRIRVEHMERQLANLTGLVQKALTQGSTVVGPGPRDFLQIPANQRDAYRNADTKPTKPAIKSSTLPRTSSQERDRHKPAPPPKPISLSSHQGQYETARHTYRADLQLTPEMYNNLRVLQKKAKDLRQEMKNLRRMSQAQAHSVRETIRDTFIKIRAMLLTGLGEQWLDSGDADKLRVSREEELYKQEMIRLEKDLTELESTVEELRGNVINKKTRVNMSDVENMALVLSKSSKTVADLKVRFPSLQDGMKSLLSSEMEKVVREEKFLKEEPERLESALRRCKKLTGTLVTLKRLASVQEQRLPIVPSNMADQQNQRLSPDNLLQEPSPQSGAISPQSKSASDGCSSSSAAALSARGLMASTGTSGSGETSKRQENALDTLLDELQTFARPPSDRHGSIDASTPTPSQSSGGSGTLRRLHSYPSSDSSSPIRSAPISRLQISDDSKPPSLPERSKVPPPPPPRTSSRSPLVSPTSPPRIVPRQSSSGAGTLLRRKREPPSEQDMNNKPLSSNSSSSESINSQEGLRGSEALEHRHQELLRRQRQLQEQYARLQQLQRNVRLPTAPELKKTGSESNLLRGLNLSAAPTSGSLTHLATTSIVPISMPNTHQTLPSSTSSKIYETDIL